MTRGEAINARASAGAHVVAVETALDLLKAKIRKLKVKDVQRALSMVADLTDELRRAKEHHKAWQHVEATWPK
jgi:ribosome-associated translation inhibitor RaiA